MYVGKPSDVSEYEVYEVEGIKVYLSPFVDARNGLKIYLSGFGMFKNLAVASGY